MKILVPALKISETDGFLPDLDIFKRKAYGESLLNLIGNTEDELVIALDAPWGEGKTTFIKMWRGLLKDEGIANIYFDAFENDYQQDPLLSISSQLYELIDKKDKNKKDEFKSKALSALKVVGRASLKVGIKALTAGILDETILKDTDNVEDASDEMSDLIDNFILKQLTNAEENRKSLATFKEYLSTLSEEMGHGKNLVFIIDELDRCKPRFALSILEIIKHLFSVPHLTFVLVMNRKQIEESVRCEYGNGVEAEKYLQKFVSVWATLPKSTDQYSIPAEIYLRNCLERMNFETNTPSNKYAVAIFEELAVYYELSLRDIEKSLTSFAVIYNALNSDNLKIHYLTILIFLSIIKVIKPEVYAQLSRKKLDYDQLLKSANLDGLKNTYEDKSQEHELKLLLQFNLSSEEDATEMAQKFQFKNFRDHRGIVDYVCKCMDSLQHVK